MNTKDLALEILVRRNFDPMELLIKIAQRNPTAFCNAVNRMNEVEPGKMYGGDPHRQLLNELRELIDRGQNIEAIKHYRLITQTGLKEAKAYIDFLRDNPRL